MQRSAHPQSLARDRETSFDAPIGRRPDAANASTERRPRGAARRFERALRHHDARCVEADAEIRAFMRGF